MAKTPFQKQVIAAIADTTDVFADKVVAKSDGTVEFKKCFFYRFNRSAHDFASEVSAVLSNAKIEHSVMGREDNGKVSYFVAVVREF